MTSTKFFFIDTATTENYTLSRHYALPISMTRLAGVQFFAAVTALVTGPLQARALGPEGRGELAAIAVLLTLAPLDRKSTRLNSSHANISYAVFCSKQKSIIVNLSYQAFSY